MTLYDMVCYRNYRMEPPVQAKEGEVVEVVQNVEALADARQSRKLQRWREEQK